jgi:hypothetical protein
MAKTISISNAELLIDAQSSSLSASATAASSTITVYSISDFAVDQILLIGEFGQEGSEIIKTHATTSPSGSTITLASNLVKSHPKDTRVYIIPYDQAQFYHSVTIAGDKTLISTSDINEEGVETVYNDTTYTSGYYFTRFYNSISTNYSDYSDAISYGGFDSNTVGYIINMAMSELKKDFTDILTYDMLINEVNSCLRYVRGKLKRWSNVQTFNYELDAALVENDYTWTLPTDYYDKNSNRSMLNIWLEEQDHLTYLDKQEFDDADREADSGTPKYYTVYDGSIYITPKVGTDYVGDSIYMDYYTDITEVNSDTDLITLSRHDMIKYWLKWQIRNITEKNGNPDFQDGDWMMFSNILNDAIRRESSGQKYKMKPFINTIDYGRINQSNFDIE